MCGIKNRNVIFLHTVASFTTVEEICREQATEIYIDIYRYIRQNMMQLHRLLKSTYRNKDFSIVRDVKLYITCSWQSRPQNLCHDWAIKAKTTLVI